MNNIVNNPLCTPVESSALQHRGSVSRRDVVRLLPTVAAGALGAAWLPAQALAFDAIRREPVFPRSSYILLTDADFQNCSVEDLYFARNEIFARHGYIFANDDLAQSFVLNRWYVPRYEAADFSYDMLNDVERLNISLIQRQEAILAGTYDPTEDELDNKGYVGNEFYGFMLPDYWRGLVDVVWSDDGLDVSIQYMGYVLMEVKAVNSKLMQAPSSTFRGLIDSWDNGRGRRIELWANNWVFATQTEYANGYVDSMYADGVSEAALIDLSTAGAFSVGSAQVATQGPDDMSGLAFYAISVAPAVKIF